MSHTLGYEIFVISLVNHTRFLLFFLSWIFDNAWFTKGSSFSSKLALQKRFTILGLSFDPRDLSHSFFYKNMAPLFTSFLRNSLKTLLFSLLVLQLSSSLSILLHQEKGRNSLGLFLVFFSWNFIKEEEVLLLSHGSNVGEFFLLFSSFLCIIILV